MSGRQTSIALLAGLAAAPAALALVPVGPASAAGAAGSPQPPAKAAKAAKGGKAAKVRKTLLLGPGREVAAGELLVRYRGQPHPRLVRVGTGATLPSTLARLRSDQEVRWAEPNAVARVARVPNDPGRSGRPGGWVEDQWNFLAPPPAGTPCSPDAPCGVDAIGAWALLRKAGMPYGHRRAGPIVAVVDTGVAYRRWGKRFRRNPDFARGSFVPGRDFVAGSDRPLDRNGHGTHVAATIIERTGNRRAVTGLAPGLRLMPVRALDRNGAGRAHAVAQGIRWAARRGAEVINLSLEFGAGFSGCKGLRTVCAAIRTAQRGGSLVVAAAGNQGLGRAQMPAQVATGVAGSTIRGCLSTTSSSGPGVELTAPGGGRDRHGAGPHCDPTAPDTASPGIVQLTFKGDPPARSFRAFGYPRYEGTSMAAAHVSAAAGLVLASRVLHRTLGRRPRPAELEAWLQCATRPPSGRTTPSGYGAGLLNLRTAVDPASRCPGL